MQRSVCGGGINNLIEKGLFAMYNPVNIKYNRCFGCFDKIKYSQLMGISFRLADYVFLLTAF